MSLFVLSPEIEDRDKVVFVVEQNIYLLIIHNNCVLFTMYHVFNQKI
jgi:hypothetical protein